MCFKSFQDTDLVERNASAEADALAVDLFVEIIASVLRAIEAGHDKSVFSRLLLRIENPYTYLEIFGFQKAQRIARCALCVIELLQYPFAQSSLSLSYGCLQLQRCFEEIPYAHRSCV